MMTVDVKYVGIYDFVPSEGAAIAFAIFFFITMAMHAFQLFRTKTWFFIPFLIWLICKSHSLARDFWILRLSSSWMRRLYSRKSQGFSPNIENKTNQSLINREHIHLPNTPTIQLRQNWPNIFSSWWLPPCWLPVSTWNSVESSS